MLTTLQKASFSARTTPVRCARALLLPALAACACARATATQASLPAGDPSRPVLAVRVAQPLERLETQAARATGELRSKLQATLSSKVSGTVAAVHVEPGQRVAAGAPLLTLDTTNASLQLKQARAALRMAVAGRDQARAELARTRALLESQSATPQLFDRVAAGAEQAEGQAEQAEAQVGLLEQALRDHVIRAPFAGVVTARLKNVGDYLAMMPPTPVVSLVSVDRIEARLAVPEGLVDRLASGATLRGQTLPGAVPFEACVTSVGAIVDANTRAVEVLADVPVQGRAGLRPGGLVEVDLGSAGEAGPGRFVPAAAVGREGARRYVWVVDGGAARRKPVEAAPVTAQWSRISAGLGAGDSVVVEGVAGLTDGARVAVSK
jgi:RND family efflux transporter MFP subunit